MSNRRITPTHLVGGALGVLLAVLFLAAGYILAGQPPPSVTPGLLPAPIPTADGRTP